MGIDFWFYLQWETETGETVKMEVWDAFDAQLFCMPRHTAFTPYFHESNFHRDDMAEIIGYPTEQYKYKKWYNDNNFRYLWHRTLEQFEGIFGSRKVRAKLSCIEDYKPFLLFLHEWRMNTQLYGWKNSRLIVATNFT